MNGWNVIKTGKTPKLNKPILIEGLPGIGNVGKVSVDFVVEEVKATKIFELTSNSMPHSVFVNEQNLVELPTISVYYKKFGRQDFLFVAGDAQPIDEISSYEFSHTVLKLLKNFKGNEIITLGGIGLPGIPKNPKVYCTGTSKEFAPAIPAGPTWAPTGGTTIPRWNRSSRSIRGIATTTNISARPRRRRRRRISAATGRPAMSGTR